MTSTDIKPESTENLEPIVFFEEEEDFNQLYEESLIGIKEQDIVHAKVSEVGKDFVIIDFGYKGVMIDTCNKNGKSSLDLLNRNDICEV